MSQEIYRGRVRDRKGAALINPTFKPGLASAKSAKSAPKPPAAELTDEEALAAAEETCDTQDDTAEAPLVLDPNAELDRSVDTDRPVSEIDAEEAAAPSLAFDPPNATQLPPADDAVSQGAGASSEEDPT